MATTSESGRLRESGVQEPRDQKRKRTLGLFDAAAASKALEGLLERNLQGTIAVSEGAADLCFFFGRGGLRVVALGRSLPTLVSRLVARGRLSASEAQRVHAAQQDGPARNDHREERELVIELLGLPPADADAAAGELAVEAFLDALAWDEPQHEATSGDPELEAFARRDLPAISLAIGLKELVQGLQQRLAGVAELKKAVPTLWGTVVEPQPKAKDAGPRAGDGPLAAARGRLLQKVVELGPTRARELARKADTGEHELLRLLVDLQGLGLVKLEKRPPTKADQDARARAVAATLDRSICPLPRRIKLAQERVQHGDKGLAARHLARAGLLQLREGRDDEAARTFAGAVEIAPDDLEAREGLVQALWGAGRAAEAAEQAVPLARRQVELGLPSRARRTLERVLSKEERTDALELLVDVLVQQRQPKAAAEVGERLVNRLVAEKQTVRAREVAAGLLELGSDQDRARLIKAAGADRTRVAALLGVAVVLGVLFVPVSQALAARERLGREASEARAELGGARTPVEAAQKLNAVEDRFRRLEADGGAVGEDARRVLEQLAPLRQDASTAITVTGMLPWEKASDLNEVLARLKAIQPKTPALAAGLQKLIDEVQQFRADGEQARDALLDHEPSPEAMAKAKTLLERYHGLKDVLDRAGVKVRVVTEPPGASVKWGDMDFKRTTPLEVTVPLRGSRELTLSLAGHASVARTIDLEGLEGAHEVTIALQKTATPPPPPPRQPPPDEAPGNTTRPPPRGTGGVGVSGGQTTPEPEAPRAQVEWKDGAWAGGGDARYAFDVDKAMLAELQVDARFRATVEGLNRKEGTGVKLIGLRVWLEVRGAQGWRAEEKPFEVELEPHTRPVQALGGGKYKVADVRRSLHLDEAWLREQALEGVQGAIRQVRIRERDRR